MKNSRTWECEYANDRRAARHRCRACSQIIHPGQRVLMVRLAGTNRATYAIHIEHADNRVMPDRGETWRQIFETWAED